MYNEISRVKMRNISETFLNLLRQCLKKLANETSLEI